jgi:hypothetical protein
MDASRLMADEIGKCKANRGALGRKNLISVAQDFCTSRTGTYGLSLMYRRAPRSFEGSKLLLCEGGVGSYRRLSGIQGLTNPYYKHEA